MAAKGTVVLHDRCCCDPANRRVGDVPQRGDAVRAVLTPRTLSGCEKPSYVYQGWLTPPLATFLSRLRRERWRSLKGCKEISPGLSLGETRGWFAQSKKHPARGARIPTSPRRPQ